MWFYNKEANTNFSFLKIKMRKLVKRVISCLSANKSSSQNIPPR